MKRKDAKLYRLSDEDQARLAEMLLDAPSVHLVREQIAKAPPDGFGISVGSTALYEFYSEVCGPLVIARRQRAVGLAREVGQEAARHPAMFDKATIDALEQKAFELAIAPHSNPKDVKALFMLVLKGRDQEIKVQQLKLDREKFEWEAAEACLKELPKLKAVASNNSLSEDEKLTAIRRHLFGELPVE